MSRSIYIRVDGNSQIGLGHIYRGIALAEMLKDDFNISFITKSDSIISPITDVGFKYSFLPEISYLEEADWLEQNIDNNAIIVCDGYFFTQEYQQSIKDKGFKLVYIDDLAKGIQKADIVINHSPGAKLNDYKCEPYTKLALGLDYALIRQSFIKVDRKSRIKNTKIENVFVSFGGADPNDFTYKVVKELIKDTKIRIVNVILGSAYKHDKITDKLSDKIVIHRNLSEEDMLRLMLNSNIAIVPASTTSIELAFVGVPMLLGYFVDNQKGIYNGMLEKEIAFPLGDFSEFDFTSLNTLIDKIDKIIAYVNNSNPQKAIIKLFSQLSVELRGVQKNDIKNVYNLSNEETVRKSSYSSELISFENHVKWFNKQLLENRSLFFIIECGGIFCGQVRFTKDNTKAIIGISISESFRGKGLATISLKIASDKYFIDNIEPIYAYIKKTNIASVKSFEKAGFVYRNEEIINGADSFVYIKKRD